MRNYLRIGIIFIIRSISRWQSAIANCAKTNERIPIDDSVQWQLAQDASRESHTQIDINVATDKITEISH